ncbi:MAG: radical SAM/SPASM domain-containing protein [Blastocatellia bacterium]
MLNSDPSLVPGGASGPTRQAILQIHPSLRCNLTCAHCYSGSGPTARAELDAATVYQVISDAAALEYEVVSVSGGEPLMYSGLEKILAHAKSLGLRTTVTTNGFFTGQERMNRLRELVDVLAISLDGPPEIHNEIRGSARAFERLEAGLENVRQSGIPFGFIHTLTRRNWEHLLWVADFAAGNGASLLQIHPLELAGRAGNQMVGDAPDDDVLANIYLLAFALEAKYSDTMKVQLDLLHRDHLREEPNLIYAAESVDGPDKSSPAQSLGLIVLEPDGTVVPVSFGFSRRYKLCNVKEHGLADIWPSYLANGFLLFKSLCRQVWDELCAPEAPLLSNWHEVIVSRSHATDVIFRAQN